ncbi:MAG: DUF6492 family protein [Chlamydiales bacterium]
MFNFQRLILFLLFLCIGPLANAQVEYPLVDDSIDVVIVSHPKDKNTVELCIDGIQQNCSQIRRLIVVSSEPLTDKAEWFDEALFPFSKEDVTLAIGRGKSLVAKSFFMHKSHRNPGWYYQQLLKLYSGFVIPGISSNVLVIDADTVFLNPVEFMNPETYGGLFCFTTFDKVKPYISAFNRYISHAKRLLPGYKRVYPEYYSISHHMLFQKPILEDLFSTVEKQHKKRFWKAFCASVDLNEGGASEYEIYFNFALTRTKQVAIRPLKWINSPDLNKRGEYQEEGYHFASFHTYLRK